MTPILQFSAIDLLRKARRFLSLRFNATVTTIVSLNQRL